MPEKRKMHPNSLANLKRGKNTQFGACGDSVANEARKKSLESRRKFSSFAEAMRERVDDDTRRMLVDNLVLNMDKSPEWYKLGLRMLGELPPEQVEVSKPAAEMAEEIREALEVRARERSAT